MPDSGNSLKIYASILRPNEGQQWQFSWGRNGVEFGQRFLGSLAGMEACTREALSLFEELHVEPLVETKVHSSAHLQQMEEMHVIQNGSAAAADPVGPLKGP